MPAGTKIGLIGSNGSGKSTLLKCLTGEVPLDTGKLWLNPDLSLANVKQNAELDDFSEFLTVGEFLKADGDPHWAQEKALSRLIKTLGMPSPERALATLSGGEFKRALLGKALLENPEVLILDEPTNHLDAKGIESLERYIQNSTQTIIVSSHDREFLTNIGCSIWEVGSGEVKAYPGDFQAYLKAKAASLSNGGKDQRLASLLLGEDSEYSRKANKVSNVTAAQRLGSKVLSLKDVSKHYDDKVICSNLSLEVISGMRLAVTGPNGSGKSSFLRILSGETSPDSGQVEVGASVRVASLAQQGLRVSPQASLWEAAKMYDTSTAARHLLALFGFKGRDQDLLFGSLSGGQKRRFGLALTFIQKPNVMILDEPTNELDMVTLLELEELLKAFSGACILTSHDRRFVSNTATHTLDFAKPGVLTLKPL